MVALLNQTIASIQKQLTERDRIRPVTVEEMTALLGVERANKNRLGIAEWLRLGIETGRLPDSRFYLGYADRLSCLRSALQKYVRRSDAEKALRCAKALYRIGKDQAVRRMKIIVVEDAFSAVEVLREFAGPMTEKRFLQIVKVTADAPKDKSLCPLAEEMTEDGPAGWKKELVERAEPDVQWLSANLRNADSYEQVVIQLYKLAKQKQWDALRQVLGSDGVIDSCLERVRGGTYWPSDTVILLMAAVRYIRGDYKLKGLTLPEIDENAIQPMKLAEIDWWCLDFHTPIGRVAKLWFRKRHPEIPERELEVAWFHAESAKLGGVIEADWERPYNRELWARYGGEVMRLVQDAMRKFELDRYGGLS